MIHGLFRRAAFAATILFALQAALPAAPQGLASGDLFQSYELLTTTYYSKVDVQGVLDGARKALAAEAAHRGVVVTLPVMRARASSGENVAQIAAEIARTETATHESETVLTYVAIGGMAKALGDQYTSFFTPEEYQKFNDALDPQKISGIGVLIEPDPATQYIRAYYVVPGTPADQAGILAGDDFISVNGTSTKGLKQEDAVKLLRGEAGTTVHLQVVRDGNPVGTLAMTRTDVQPPTVIYKMLPGKIGYVAILTFGRETPDQFGAALNRLEDQGVRGYILDLRNNGGGYVNSALDISSKFINNNPLLTVEERGSHVYTVQAPQDALPAKPMTILVNRYTASASEITAGALQDNGIGVLVGEKTYGKGVMQSLTQLPDGAAIKITTAHYLTPKHRDINLKGIEPDFAVTENKNARFGDATNDAQLQAAISILTKKIADR
ncbi:MAG TPA: S41 family peptidase [Candidatus Rubrimentiphilum sp.]|nr:S41 family peptidase [Candidatus Rubrimentiphilum sp.]